MTKHKKLEKKGLGPSKARANSPTTTSKKKKKKKRDGGQQVQTEEDAPPLLACKGLANLHHPPPQPLPPPLRRHRNITEVRKQVHVVPSGAEQAVELVSQHKGNKTRVVVVVVVGVMRDCFSSVFLFSLYFTHE